MEASAWLLLISIPALLVALFFHRRQAQFRGIGLFGANCPRCAAPLPTVYLSAKHCGADGRANTAAAKSIGTVGREIGNPQTALGKKAPLSRRFKSDHQELEAARHVGGCKGVGLR